MYLRPVLPRTHHEAEVLRRLGAYPVVAIVGARQVGKTTLAGRIAAGASEPVTVFDLERPSDLTRLSEPELTLEPLRGLVVLDEIHRAPDLFRTLRVPAGRISYYELPGLVAGETGLDAIEQLWVRGGFPRAFLAPDDALSDLWRRDFIQTYLERDLPGLGLRMPPTTLRRFWTMLAHAHGQLWNLSLIHI